MVRADIKRRILSRSVFHGEQEYAIVSEMILGGDILQIKDTVAEKKKSTTRAHNFTRSIA